MLGRAFAPMALKRISELRVIQSGVLVGIAGIIILMGASTFRGIASGTVVAGFGFSAVFPVLMSWVVEYYGIAARRIGGQMLGLGILGGAVLPWLIGYLSTRFGSLKEGLAIVFVTLIATLILFSLLPRSPADATNIF